MSDKRRVGDSLVGMAVLGGAVTGAASLIGALFAFFSVDFAGAGMLLIAAALSFGLLGIAIIRR